MCGLPRHLHPAATVPIVRLQYMILSKRAAVLLRLIIAIALPLTAVAQDPTEPESLYRIAQFLLVPESNSDEITRGLGYLKRAADAGYEPAARVYARRLASGDGVPQDEIAARRYYQLAAAKGDPASQLALAWMYQDGLGGCQWHPNNPHLR